MCEKHDYKTDMDFILVSQVRKILLQWGRKATGVNGGKGDSMLQIPTLIGVSVLTKV